MRPNLYKDEDGNFVKGRYVYSIALGKFSAMCKYPEGYSKTKIFYTFEDAVAFVEKDYDKYKTGEYIDNDGNLVIMTKKGDVKPKRMF